MSLRKWVRAARGVHEYRDGDLVLATVKNEGVGHTSPEWIAYRAGGEEVMIHNSRLHDVKRSVERQLEMTA